MKIAVINVDDGCNVSVKGGHLHFGVDAVGDLVALLSGRGVRLGQQTRVRTQTVLWFDELEEKQSENGGLFRFSLSAQVQEQLPLNL